MSTQILRPFVQSGLALALLLAWPGAAAATVDGGCKAEGHSTTTTIDLTTQAVWHLKSTDVAGGSGTAPAPMTSASVGAYALGIYIPIRSGTGSGGVSGAVDGVDLAIFKSLGKVFMVGGSASGPGGAACSLKVQIILDDASPAFTLLGGGGLVLAAIGALAILMGARSGGGLGSGILALLLGGLGGAGLGVALEQFGMVDPTAPIGLALLAVGALAGLLLNGRLGVRKGMVPDSPA